jgi:hypothetical protein
MRRCGRWSAIFVICRREVVLALHKYSYRRERSTPTFAEGSTRNESIQVAAWLAD